MSRVLLFLTAILTLTHLPAQPAWNVTRTNLSGVSGAWSVAYGNGRFVATLLGSFPNTPGTASSTDGLSWRASATPVPRAGKILFVGGAFYLAADSAIYRSTDGDTWLPIFNGLGQFNGLVSNGRSMLATSIHHNLIISVFSPDLTAWRYNAPLPDANPLTYQPTPGVVGDRYFLHYYTSGGRRAVSTPDGLQWTFVSPLAAATDLTSGNGLLVGLISSDTTGSMAFSTPDGISLSNFPISPLIGSGGRMGYAGGRYFSLGTLIASSDAQTWTPLATFTPVASGNMTGIAYGNGRFVAVGNSAGQADVVVVLSATAPPVIIAEPQPLTVSVGDRAAFGVGIDNDTLPTTYQWHHHGAALAGATAATYVIDRVALENLGDYHVVLRNAVGTATSLTAALSRPSPPVITTPLAGHTLEPGQTAILTVNVSGTPPFTYQWHRNGTAMLGTTGLGIIVDADRTDDLGTYTVTVSNPSGTVTSAPATIAFTVTVPVVSIRPGLVAVGPGAPFSLNANVTGPAPLTYRWERDGVVVAGATTATMTLLAATTADAGTYRLAVSNAFGTAYTLPLTLSVSAIKRISNLSVLTSLDSPADSFRLGYVVGGAGSIGSKSLVIRAAGPSLGSVGVRDPLPDPKLELFAGTAKLTENDDWGGGSSLATAFASVGAFPFASPTSKDAAVTASLTTRDNSVRISAAAPGTGPVLAEIYDATPSADFTVSTPRLLNVSVLKSLGTGLTVGFTLDGAGTRLILVRAIGPTLSEFGVSGVAADPRLAVFDASSFKIAENDNWADTPGISDAFTAVGAFTLSPTSKDAARLLLLPPGGYSVQVTDAAGGGGAALVEVYEVP